MLMFVLISSVIGGIILALFSEIILPAKERKKYQKKEVRLKRRGRK